MKLIYIKDICQALLKVTKKIIHLLYPAVVDCKNGHSPSPCPAPMPLQCHLVATSIKKWPISPPLEAGMIGNYHRARKCDRHVSSEPRP